jgi:pimeloyl-ACP methyl ester carboxylesterase
MSAFGEQVLALLDHLSAERAIVGGTSLGANVGLEVAAAAPERVQGSCSRCPCSTTRSRQASSRSRRCCSSRGSSPSGSGCSPVRAVSCRAAACHCWLRSRSTPSTSVRVRWRRWCTDLLRSRRTVEPHPQDDRDARDRHRHPHDPIHLSVDAEMVAEEMPNARFVRASSILEWRIKPDRLNRELLEFVNEAWNPPEARRA